ncbi:MAG: arsenate reductase ArsC [Magnetococcus sp. WYHC-3]
MSNKIYNVLFLCTGNSARSIIAECILNQEGRGRFRGYSAGSHPRGDINPYAYAFLQHMKHPVESLRSKGMDEFTQGITLDFVFTVCDQAAREPCPVWPGQPMTAHWGMPDPAVVQGSEAVRRQAIADTYRMLLQRISIFVNLPIASLDRLSLQHRLDDVGKLAAPSPEIRS